MLDTPQRLRHRSVDAVQIADRDARIGHVFVLLRVDIDRPENTYDLLVPISSGIDDPADHFALQARVIETPLARDDQIRGVDAPIEVHFVGNHVEAGNQPCSENGQCSSQSTRRSGPFDTGDVEPVRLEVALREMLQTVRQETNLGWACTLLRSEDLGGIGEASGDIAGDDELDGLESRGRSNGIDGPQSSICGRRPTEADDDARCSEIEGSIDQFTGADGRCSNGVVRICSADQSQAACSSHFDDCSAAMEAPWGIDWCTERSCDRGRAIGAAEDVECPLATIGQWNLVAVQPEFPACVADRPCDIECRRRSFEFVDCSSNAHRISLSWQTRIR